MPSLRPSAYPRWARTAAGAPASNITVPSSGEQDTGWTSGQTPVSSGKANWKDQNVYDWIAYLDSIQAVSFLETFEAATFPPTATPGWSAPSARFPSDLAYVRDTAAPNLIGSAGANRPGSQGASQNSSLGLEVFLPSPSRVCFFYTVLGNVALDTLQFLIDGFAVNSVTSTVGPVAQTGRYVSFLLREGRHTFDWRWIRSSSASVGSEVAKIDQVEIIPETAFLDYQNYSLISLPNAPVQKFYFNDDFMYGATFPAGPWEGITGANAGTTAIIQPTSTELGLLRLRTASIAIGDSQAISMYSPGGVGGPAAGDFPYVEWKSRFPSVGSNGFELGFWDKTTNNKICWMLDTSLGTTLRIRATTGGTSTTFDTGITPGTGNSNIYGISWVSSGICFTINGIQFPSGVAIPSIISNIPNLQLLPYARAFSVGAASQVDLLVDAFRMLNNRN